MPLCDCMDDISSADNADDLAIRIDDRCAANVFLRKKMGSFLRAGAWMDSMDIACHYITRDHRTHSLI